MARRITREFITGRPSSEMATAPAAFMLPMAASSTPSLPFVMAPMGTNYSTTDGLSTQRDKQYYAERAKGGVAMIMTEAMVVTEHARPHHNSLCVYHDRFIPGLASIVEAIKEHDCHVFGQLNHRGALLRRSVLNMEPVGPSPWRNPNTGDVGMWAMSNGQATWLDIGTSSTSFNIVKS